MIDGPNPNDTSTASPALTVDEAAPVLEGLLSPAKPEKKAKPAATPLEPTDAELQTPDENEEPEVEEIERPDEPDVEAEGEPELETPEQEEDVDEPLEPQKFKVPKGDGEEEVTEKELKDGYLRTADYTRKSQANAEARKKFDTEEVPQLRAERQQLAGRLKNVEEALRSISPQEPDWDRIRTDQPEQLANIKADWDITQDRLRQVQDARAAADAKVQEDQDAQLAEYVKSERGKLLEAVPTWSDEKLAVKEKTEIAQYALSRGYEAADLKNVTDHRLMLILRDAMIGQRASKKTPVIKRTIEAVRAATPGPKETQRPKETEYRKATDRLARSHSVDDAADVFDIMFKDAAKAKAKAAR